MDRVLKEIAKKLEKEEPPSTHRLPSSDFIKFYLSSWSCDVFNCEAMKIPGKEPAVVETQRMEKNKTAEEGHSEKTEEERGGNEKGSAVDEKGDDEKMSETSDSVKNGSPEKGEEKVEESEDKKEVKLPSRLIKAYEDLEKAFEKMKTFEYEKAYELVKTSVKNFNAVSLLMTSCLVGFIMDFCSAMFYVLLRQKRCVCFITIFYSLLHYERMSVPFI